LLVAIPEGPLQVQLVPGAFLHVLFGRSLSLNGMPGAFSPDDPRGPAQGDPPTATEGFRDWYLTRAREDGILLRPQADLCEFRPGGGSWVRESWQGNLSYRYLGGGRGQDMGWVPGSHRWVLSGGRWTSSTGQTFQSFLGGWLYQGQGRLAGTLFADGCPLWMSGRLTLEGCAIAWDAPLVVWRGALQVDCPSSTLALAALGSPGEPRPWAQDQEPRAGDLVVAGGAALTVGDVLRAEETGALVLAQGRLVKRGAGLRLAGVAAAQRIELDGVPAGQYVWSGRLLRQPPPCVEGGAVALGRSGVANQP
ncbi:MAG TPA: hypothetical protein VNO81_09970, partial [Candidatus Nitrosotenuis sp.]|nr:hypothetical protein [Candidatus Nitrosotenuis sp.]